MAKATTSTSLVKYASYTVEDAEEDRKEADAAKGGGIFLKIPPGKLRIRFVPALEGRKWKRVSYQHYVDVPGVGRVSFTCPAFETKGKVACPACKTEKKLLASKNEVDHERAKKFKARRRCFSSVIVRGEEELGARILPYGAQIEDQLIELRKDEDIGGDFIHPVNGFDVLLIRKGTTQNDTEYKIAAADKGKSCPLVDDVKEMNELIESQPNLDRAVVVYTEEGIQKLLRGEKPDQEDRWVDPSQRPAKSKKDEDEDDDDASPPAKKKASKTIDKEIDDDEEDDFEDDEEEDDE